MHEVSVAQALVASVSAALADEPGRVTEVRIRVGALSGVVPAALQFAYDVVCAGTRLEGSVLAIEPVPATVHCGACGADSDIVERLVFLCPHCGEPTGDVLAGHELDVVAVVLEDDDAPDEAEEAAEPARPEPLGAPA